MIVRSLLCFVGLALAGCAAGSPHTPAEDADSADEGMTDSAASTDGSLRVMTYNIKNGDVVKHDLSQIANVLKASTPDVVGLEEVDDGTTRSLGKHEATEIAQLAGMPYSYFAPNFAYQGGQYGLAILSKYPLANTEVVRLDDHTQDVNGYEPRIAAIADVQAKGHSFTFVTVHASLHAEEHALNAQRILAGLGARAAHAYVVGDFNEEPNNTLGNALVAAGFVDAYHEKHDFGFSEPASFPIHRIDFIYRPKSIGATVHAWVPDVQASDHRPVGAVIPLP